MKGTCGFLAFPKLEAVAQAGESLLCRLRDGRLLLNAEITSALLALVNAARLILKNIENDRQEGKGDYDSVMTLVAQLRDSR
jgi:two-component system, chemotaxis family, sensor kinase CheA